VSELEKIHVAILVRGLEICVYLCQPSQKAKTKPIWD